MESRTTEILAGLREAFCGAEWERAVRRAQEENEWFTAGQVGHAVRALREELLQPERIERWLNAYPKPEGWQPGRVGIVMAGNLPLVGFADLAAAVGAGHRVAVKPASKDRALMEYVVRRLQRSGCPVETTDALRNGEVDRVIATGSDTTRDYFARYFAGVPALLRGSRQSVAVLEGTETDEVWSGLAEDMLLYWGLGCRSVVRLFVPRGYDVQGLADRIAAESPLRGEECPKYAACYRYARAMAAMSGAPWVDGGSFVWRQLPMESGPTVPRIAEAFWSEYDSPDELSAWLMRWERGLQCAAGAVPAGFPRRTAFGRTQRPGWSDYADGVDTMRFLLEG